MRAKRDEENKFFDYQEKDASPRPGAAGWFE
jgi:hypothetical protein